MKPKLEYIPHEIDGSIHSFTYQNKYFEDPWHYHEDYELTYIIKGSGIRHVGSSVDNFTLGDLVLIGKEIPHCWTNALNYNAGVLSACVQWKTKTIDNFIEGSFELKSIHNLLEASKSGVKFTDNRFSKSIGNRLIALNQLSPGKKIIELLDILLELSSTKNKKLLSANKASYNFTEKSNSRIASILNYVDKNYQHKISIKDMADLVYMTKSSFCKYFKKEFKKSFTNYLNEFRIRKACLLLYETDKNLLDISMSCGYENMSFFHRQFKKYLKMTPNEYRKKIYNSLHLG